MPINNKINDIKDMFLVFDNLMDKYLQLIELGKKNSGLNDADKTNENRIYGCASLAWIKTTKNKNSFSIQIDSDTFIVKGLLNILQYIIKESTKKEIFNLKVRNILENIGLEESITSQRTNGFLSALDKIKNQINNNEYK